jgi:hypothetical protein
MIELTVLLEEAEEKKVHFLLRRCEPEQGKGMTAVILFIIKKFSPFRFSSSQSLHLIPDLSFPCHRWQCLSLPSGSQSMIRLITCSKCYV